MSTAGWVAIALAYAYTVAAYLFFLPLVHEGGSKRSRARLTLLAPVWPLAALRALHHAIHQLWRDALSDDDRE